MLDFSQMIARFLLSLLLGGIIGLERELVGKEAGVRTAMMVSAGACIFTIIGLESPYIIEAGNAVADSVRSGALSIIGGVVTGIGFLGAGTIIKTEDHAKGLTTAAVIWTTAAIGTLTGLGLSYFAVAAGVCVALVLFALRNFGLNEHTQEKNLRFRKDLD